MKVVRHAPLGLASFVALVVALPLACGGPAPASSSTQERITAGMPSHDAAIERACALTARRCTACHDPDRFLDLRLGRPAQWEGYIDRMRRMRGSGISVADGGQILRCLVFRSFGAVGLRAIDPDG
jgi:hypothetical protein